MNTSAEENGAVEKTEGTDSCCDAACSCHSGGLSTKVKVAVCLVVALAAVAVVLLGSANKGRTATAATPFATAAVANAQAPASATGTPTATATPTEIWGPTLSSLTSLNQVAADKDAVFVFVPSDDEKQTALVRTQIQSAAKKAQAKGSVVAAYTLSNEAKEYADITKQVAAPCVLVMAKGAGAAPVSGEITETKLLEALVAASRPSSCGPSGCGPTSSGCN
ncbi:MAG: hypothetical protein ACYC63_09995 [Armatimonadota bacterium]